MDWVDQLQTVLVAPAEPSGQPSAADWARVATETNLTFPSDFKQFLNTWGQAYIGGFLFPYSPNGTTRANELQSGVEYVSRALTTLKSHHPDSMPAPVFPEKGGFVAGGISDNGDFIGWMTVSSDPDQWPVAVWGHEDDVPEVFEGTGFGAFILGVVQGDIRPVAFPSGLWNKVPLRDEDR